MKINRTLITAVAAAAVISSIWYFTGSRAEKGLYEYIREARQYMEEGKHKKGLGLLRRAFDRAPDNKEIKKELLYGYIRVAGDLEEQGDLDEAIDLLSTAYEISATRVVRNNLAFLLSKRAVLECRKKRYGRAMEYFTRVTSVAMPSMTVRQNISRYLFNQAVDAYRKGHSRAVMLCLNTSYALHKRFETLDFLGQYYYGR